MTIVADNPTTHPQTLYVPYENGKYEVKAGLFKLGQHAVHGNVETNVYMIDDQYRRYLQSKCEARSTLYRHYQQAALAPALRERSLRFLFARLAEEYPHAITWDAEQGLLTNRWLGWQGRVDVRSGGVTITERTAAPFGDLVAVVEPVDAFDFLALNIQEDFALVARDPETGDDWLPLVHICAPHHWDPRDKVGRGFGPVHVPVGEIEPLVATAPKMMRAVVEQGPFIRFAWGLAMNDVLNHHPDAPHEGDRALPEGAGAALTAYWDEHLFMRVERQVIWSFPEAQGALFTIRPYWYRVYDLAQDPTRREQLTAAIRSMKAPSVLYKGMTETREPVLAYLESRFQ